MEPIAFDRTCYRVQGRPFYLNSGEFHYFRVPKADWRRRMALFKEAGGNCLATYVPWVVHEPAEGQFSFGQRPFDDLEGFLKTAREDGLYVIARPGPYQYSELLYAGLPHWLCDRYPEILARDIHGNPLRFYSVSYLHPTFLAKARAWFDQVCPIIARHTVRHGGPVALAQFDNELTGIHIWYGSLDYNAETMGFGRPEGRWACFLREQYGDIAALNRAYGLAASRFEEVPPVPGEPIRDAQGRRVHRAGDPTPASLRWRKDYFTFYLHTVAEYARTLTGWMREHGIDVPVVHNAANPDMNFLFQETIAALPGDFLLGSDHYYNLEQTWPQNNPTPQYARAVLCSTESLRLLGYPPTVFELPGGSLSDWPPIAPQDARACYMANLALGMKGHNYYILTGGPNPPGLGSTADVYDYGAAIAADGTLRPLYEVQKEVGLWLRDHPWLVEAEREADCRLALDREMARAHHYWPDRGDLPLSSPEAWQFLLRGPLTTALCAGLSPAFCDLDSDDWTADTGTPVVVVASAAMSAARQARVVRFLRHGGRALIAPLLPTLDEAWRACTILADFVGQPALCPGGRQPTRLSIAGVTNIYNNGEAFYPQNAPRDALPAGAEILGIDERSGAPVCWAIRTDGGGEAIVLGFLWYHAMREHERMLINLLRRLGLEQKVHCSNPNVWTSLRTAGGRSLLFLLNLLSAPMEASVRCRPAWSEDTIDAGTYHLAPMTVQCVELGADSGLGPT